MSLSDTSAFPQSAALRLRIQLERLTVPHSPEPRLIMCNGKPPALLQYTQVAAAVTDADPIVLEHVGRGFSPDT